MSNSYTFFSEQIEGLTPAAAAWVKMVRALDPEVPEDLEKLMAELDLAADPDEELDNWPCFEAEIKDGETNLWLYSEEGLIDSHLILFVQALFEKFMPDCVFSANFACTCSKPLLGEFGGYWIGISKDSVESGSTWDASLEAVKKLRKQQKGG
jgi:hypothetical protein